MFTLVFPALRMGTDTQQVFNKYDIKEWKDSQSTMCNFIVLYVN